MAVVVVRALEVIPAFRCPEPNSVPRPSTWRRARVNRPAFGFLIGRRLEYPVHRFHQHFSGKWFVEREGGAEVLGHAQVVLGVGAAAGHRDDLQCRETLAQFADGFEALLLGHDQVGDDQIEVFVLGQIHRDLAVGGKGRAVAGGVEGIDHRGEQCRVVVDQQNLGHTCVTFTLIRGTGMFSCAPGGARPERASTAEVSAMLSRWKRGSICPFGRVKKNVALSMTTSTVVVGVRCGQRAPADST